MKIEIFLLVIRSIPAADRGYNLNLLGLFFVISSERSNTNIVAPGPHSNKKITAAAVRFASQNDRVYFIQKFDIYFGNRSPVRPKDLTGYSVCLAVDNALKRKCQDCGCQHATFRTSRNLH